MNHYDWHPWFVWYPKWIHFERKVGAAGGLGRFIWLRRVECRIRGAIAPNGDLTDYWEYRLP